MPNDAPQKTYQVIFGNMAPNGSVTPNGHGEQVVAANEDAVRQMMAKRYGAEYPIVSINEV